MGAKALVTVYFKERGLQGVEDAQSIILVFSGWRDPTDRVWGGGVLRRQLTRSPILAPAKTNKPTRRYIQTIAHEIFHAVTSYTADLA